MNDPDAQSDPAGKAHAEPQRQPPGTSEAAGTEGLAWERPASYVLLGGFFGLLTALTESGLYALKEHFHLAILSDSATHYQWMPAVAYVGFFGFLGTLWGLITCCLPRKWRPKLCLRAAAWFFGFIYFLTNLNHLDSFAQLGMSLYAEVMLALGLCVAVASWLIARPAKFYKHVRIGVPVMALLTAVWAGGAVSFQWWAERQMLTKLPAESPTTPNVLLIVWDTVRAQNLSLYGYPRPTTVRLQKLAASGVVFDSAVATASWTLPSHAGMFTGRCVHEMPNLRWTPLPDRFTTLAESLYEKGYVTAGFVANREFCSRHSGLNQGFTHYDDTRISIGNVLHTSWLFRGIWNRSMRFRELIRAYDPPGRKRAGHVNEEFLCWLSRQPRRPFFAFLNYLDAHDPYLPPPPFDKEYGPHNDRDRLLLSNWPVSAIQADGDTEQHIQTAVDAYDGCIAYLDSQLDSLLSELEKRGVLDDTLVIVTSDHGEQFGEHGIFWHATSLHQPQTHVPLVMVLPGRIPQGRRIREAVSLRELPASVLDLLQTSDSRIAGESLARYWQPLGPGESPAPASPLLAELEQADWMGLPWHYPNAQGPVKAVWSDGKKYIYTEARGQEELYNLEDDPLETRSLAESVQQRPVLDHLRQRLSRLLPGPKADPSVPWVASQIGATPTGRNAGPRNRPK